MLTVSVIYFYPDVICIFQLIQPWWPFVAIHPEVEVEGVSRSLGSASVMSQMPGKGINAQKQAGKNNPAPGSKDHIFSISCVYPAPPDSYESWNHRLHLGVIMIFLNS